MFGLDPTAAVAHLDDDVRALRPAHNEDASDVGVAYRVGNNVIPTQEPCLRASLRPVPGKHVHAPRSHREIVAKAVLYAASKIVRSFRKAK